MATVEIYNGIKVDSLSQITRLDLINSSYSVSGNTMTVDLANSNFNYDYVKFVSPQNYSLPEDGSFAKPYATIQAAADWFAANPPPMVPFPTTAHIILMEGVYDNSNGNGGLKISDNIKHLAITPFGGVNNIVWIIDTTIDIDCQSHKHIIIRDLLMANATGGPLINIHENSTVLMGFKNCVYISNSPSDTFQTNDPSILEEHFYFEDCVLNGFVYTRTCPGLVSIKNCLMMGGIVSMNTSVGELQLWNTLAHDSAITADEATIRIQNSTCGTITSNATNASALALYMVNSTTTNVDTSGVPTLVEHPVTLNAGYYYMVNAAIGVFTPNSAISV